MVKSRFLLSFVTLFGLNLALSSRMVVASSGDAQQVVAQIFEANSDDSERLRLLYVHLEEIIHAQDHNFFQRAAKMDVSADLACMQEYICYQKEIELHVQPYREAIKFFEAKRSFEYKQKVQAWEEGREERRKKRFRNNVFVAGFSLVSLWFIIKYDIRF